MAGSSWRFFLGAVSWFVLQGRARAPPPSVNPDPTVETVSGQKWVQGLWLACWGFCFSLKLLFQQFNGIAKDHGRRILWAPINVVLELLLGLVFSTWAALTVPGKFVSIHPDSGENRIVSLPANLDFMIFNHRGKAVLSGVNMKLKH